MLANETKYIKRTATYFGNQPTIELTTSKHNYLRSSIRTAKFFFETRVDYTKYLNGSYDRIAFVVSFDGSTTAIY